VLGFFFLRITYCFFAFCSKILPFLICSTTLFFGFWLSLSFSLFPSLSPYKSKLCQKLVSIERKKKGGHSIDVLPTSFNSKERKSKKTSC
jgi:hypothetical protein